MSLPPYDQSIRDFERQFQVVLPDALGQATVGFREGVWYRLNSGAPHPVPIRSAIILCPHAAGSIVQIACWWMRENARSPRALDLATELALTVGELARKAIEDDPLGMSLNTLSTSSVNAASSLGSSAPLGTSGAFAGAGAGSLGSSSGYDSGSYSTDPYASAVQPTPSYEPVYAAAQPAPSYESPYAAVPPAAATTLLPQITPEMTAPPGRLLGGVPRQPGPQPGLAPLPPNAGRPGASGGGYGGARGPMPGGRPPMGAGSPGQSGSWDRPGVPDPRSGRPAGGPPPRPGVYDGSEPRDDFFRNGPQQQRRPEEYGGGRAPSRPTRQEPGRSW
jgi:hypothetical protein